MDTEQLKNENIPSQKQPPPGKEHKMVPEPEIIKEHYKSAGKLSKKITLITGGDSGIGRAIAVHFAKEGSDIGIVYLQEDDDALKTKEMAEDAGARCVIIQGDLRDKEFCQQCVQMCVEKLGGLNVLINNAGEQHPHEGILDMDLDKMESTFRTNIISMMYITKAAVPHLKKGDSIINTASIVAFQGRKYLIDYGATKSAIVGFTRSLNNDLAPKGIRVNAVAPGPVWTPLIPSTFSPEHVAGFGKSTPLGRPGQPSEIAPAYVFLASDDASYISGQIIHVNGGEPA